MSIFCIDTLNLLAFCVYIFQFLKNIVKNFCYVHIFTVESI